MCATIVIKARILLLTVAQRFMYVNCSCKCKYKVVGAVGSSGPLVY